MAAPESRGAILAAFFANFVIAIAKMGGFFFTRSSALLAESVHSFADTGNQLLLLLGGRLAQRPATSKHPFGYGRERYFWSFIVSIVLFLLGGAFAIFEGISKLRHPEELKSIQWALGILIMAIIAEALSFRTAIRASNKVRGKSSWPNFVRKAKSPELPVVLLEDLGALAGLVIALGAVVVAEVTNQPRWDAIGTLCIGGLLCIIAIVLSLEMRSLLLGESANPKNQNQILQIFNAAEEIDSLLELRTLHLGPEEILVTARAALDSSLTMEQTTDLIDRLTADIKQAVPIAAVVYIQPE